MFHIIIPTDLSSSALEAVTHAVQLFGSQRLRIDLVHAHFDPGLHDNSYYAPDLLESAGRELETLAIRCGEENPEVRIEQRTLVGPIPNALNAYVHDEGGDVFLMTTSGRQGSAFFGSRTNDIIGASSIPVVVLPKGTGTVQPKRMLLAMDPDDPWTGDLELFRSFAGAHGYELLIVHVSEGMVSVPMTKDDHHHLFPGLNVQVLDAKTPDIEDGLLRVANRQQADMIAVMHQHQGLIRGLFHHSVTKELALDSPLPLFVLIRK